MNDNFIPAKTLDEANQRLRVQMESIKTYQVELHKLHAENKALRGLLAEARIPVIEQRAFVYEEGENTQLLGLCYLLDKIETALGERQETEK